MAERDIGCKEMFDPDRVISPLKFYVYVVIYSDNDPNIDGIEKSRLIH